MLGCFLYDLLLVLVIKRQASTKHGVSDDADASDIGQCRVALLGQDLRSSVAKRPTGLGLHVSRLAQFRKSEISQFNMWDLLIRRNQNILRLDIPMNHSNLMQVLSHL